MRSNQESGWKFVFSLQSFLLLLQSHNVKYINNNFLLKAMQYSPSK